MNLETERSDKTPKEYVSVFSTMFDQTLALLKSFVNPHKALFRIECILAVIPTWFSYGRETGIGIVSPQQFSSRLHRIKRSLISTPKYIFPRPFFSHFIIKTYQYISI